MLFAFFNEGGKLVELGTTDSSLHIGRFKVISKVAIDIFMVISER